MSAAVEIGENVTIKSHCTLHSCHIEQDAYIGERCVILEGARVEAGAMLAPGSVVPPGRLIPAKQMWAGNPVEYVKDLDIGEAWSNYTLSYINANLGDVHKNEFTLWPSNYLKRETTADDAEPQVEDYAAQYAVKNVYRGIVKYYST